ncbi:heavy-metal-associated domain-containing protein [Nonlabens sp.]|uniref:heavy-metal-associated domain-containing protein n=1 Tax=Nonlabens sp. TaxID=1888209 RepID=UPI003F69BFDC
MKQITIILSIIVGLLTFTTTYAQTKKDRDQYEIQVDGLGCPFCAYGLEKKFKEFKGIKDIAIDIETGDFSFTYPAKQPLTMETVLAQVVKSGYTPNDSKITRYDGSIETNEKSEEIALQDVTSARLYVNGMCGMCKARIEKATTAITGVASAVWDVDTKMLSVKYDPNKTSESAIEKAAAQVGHDTKGTRATDEAYDNLHACCKYKRAQ